MLLENRFNYPLVNRFANALALPCRVLTVHGSMDQIVPVKDALEFDKIITNHVLRIIQGADHEYTSHQNELVKVVLDFIRDHSRCNDTMEHSPSRVHGLSSISPRL